MTNENELNDEFRGGNDHLISCMGALVQMNAENALTPHGIGSHASIMLSSAALRLESQQSRIELLESAICEYENVNCELAKLSDDDRMNERNSAKYLKAYYAMIGLIKPNGE